jgi:DNA-binding NtrC family response regulator
MTEIGMPAPKLALVVEDDEFQREILSDFLKEENLDVIQCESAEAAELIIARVGAELSLMVADFHLAGEGTGLDLAAFAQARFPHLRVIVISGDDNLRGAVKELAVNARFLQKPFHPWQLLVD